MGYAYAYIISAIVIAVVILLFIFYLGQKQAPPQKPQILVPQDLTKMLKVSCSSGTNPLSVGFFLDDPDHIYMKKIWRWGDGNTENNAVNTVTHKYTLYGTNKTSYLFKGNVTEWDAMHPTMPFGVANFTIQVTQQQENKILSGFDQLEAVIVQDDYLGFSTATNGITTTAPVFTWNWNDSSSNPVESGVFDKNPSHKYVSPNTYTGTLLVQDPSNPANHDVKNFCVLVLPSTSTRTAEMNITYFEDPSQTQFYQGHPLEFQIDSGVGSRAVAQKNYYSYAPRWNFGDNGTDLQWCNREHFVQSCHTFKYPGNYTITFNGTDQSGLPASLTKTIQVSHLPSIVASQPKIVGGKTVFSVRGQYFSPKSSEIIFHLCFDDRCLDNRSVGSVFPKDGQFNSVVTVQDLLQPGKHNLFATSSLCPPFDCIDNATAVITK